MNDVLIQKIKQEIKSIPFEDGKNWININVNLLNVNCGTITFGFGHKLHMGTIDFSSLDQALQIVQDLKKEYGFEITTSNEFMKPDHLCMVYKGHEFILKTIGKVEDDEMHLSHKDWLVKRITEQIPDIVEKMIQI